MSPFPDSFRDEYVSAFRSYLVGAGETGLESAYELGRNAVTGELSLLDLAGIHHEALLDHLAQATDPSETERISKAGTDFFLESLSTFEMTQRGFLEAQETAQLQQRHAGQLRGLADASLAVNSTLSIDEMLALLEQRAREIVGAGRARVTMGAEDPPASGPAWLSAPLIDRKGRRLGVIQLRDKHEGEFSEDDRSILVQLAQMTSVAVENARLYEHERSVAETLQHNLLPEGLPDIPGVSTAARYMAGGAGVEVGGDWYDVIPLPGDRVGVAIGDVVGRGIRAAAIMGQLRVVLRAYAIESDDSSEVLRRLAGFVNTLEVEQMTTCVYAVLDAEDGILRFTNAGHPPPLALAPDGGAAFLEGNHGMPLGVVRDAAYVESVAELASGTTVLLYTDGLVEERGEPIDTGLERLRALAEQAPREPEALLERVLQDLVGGAPGDDVALLAVRGLPQHGERLDLELPAEPSTLAPLRRRLGQWLEGAGATPAEAYDVTLATCEAAANAVEHAYGPGDAMFELKVKVVDDMVVVDVRDFGHWRPARNTQRGRGLGVMRETMDHVEVNSEREGTNVRLRRRLGEGAGGTARANRD